MIKKVSFDSKDISYRMVGRLTEYLRILKELRKNNESINSIDLANKMNSTAAQVRKDLSTFGEFGTRGKGYEISNLIEVLEYILGINEENDLILVGYGKMGSMLASNVEVLGKNFKIIEVFEKNEEKIGKKIEELDLEIKDVLKMKKYLDLKKTNQAILAVTKENAQEVANELINLGITGILNLTSYSLETPDYVVVVDVDISAKLQELNFWRRKINLDN